MLPQGRDGFDTKMKLEHLHSTIRLPLHVLHAVNKWYFFSRFGLSDGQSFYCRGKSSRKQARLSVAWQNVE